MHRKIFVILPVLLAASLATSSCSNVSLDKFGLEKDPRSKKYHCVQAEGEWSAGSFLLGRAKLEPGKAIQYDVKISCWGFYRIWLSTILNDNLSVVVDESGRKAYAEIIRSADGEIRRRYSKLHKIRYAVTLTSMNNPRRAISKNEPWTLPAARSSVGWMNVIIPIHFRRNEKFRISVEVEADPDFYDDYKWLGTVIALPIH